MAAQREFYEDKKYSIPYLNSSGVLIIDEINIPAHLSEYGSTPSAIAQKFHLDIVIPKGSGFLGGVKLDNRTASGELINADYHNTHNIYPDGTDGSSYKGDNTTTSIIPNRLSKLRICYNGVKYALFNDGGLNTKPDCNEVLIDRIKEATSMILWAGKLGVVRVSFEAARFINTTVRKIEIINSLGNAVLCSLTLDPVNQNTGEKIDIYSLAQFSGDHYLNKGASVKMRLTTANAEGQIIKEFSTTVREEVDLPYAADYYDMDLPTPGNPTQGGVRIYKFTADDLGVVTESASNTGIYLYTDIRMNLATILNPNLAAQGWYSFSGKDYYYVDNNGQVTKKITLSDGISRDYTQYIPVIINGNIGIQIGVKAGGAGIKVQSISYYDAQDSTNSNGTQSVGYTIEEDQPPGTMIDTGISINKLGAWARFSLYPTSMNNGLYNPITMLMSNTFDQEL